MKTIQISDDLYQHIQAHIQGSDEFDSPEEYIDFVLESVINGDEDIDGDDDDEEATEKRESKVKNRLENLGYLD